MLPSTVLLRIEFTAPDTSEPAGELLPHLSTLTRTSRAVSLCCTCPEVAFGGRYPLFLPCGARTFLTHGPLGPYARLSSLLALLFYRISKGLSILPGGFRLYISASPLPCFFNNFTKPWEKGRSSCYGQAAFQIVLKYGCVEKNDYSSPYRRAGRRLWALRLW